jgi:hypothetical protein
MRFTKAIVSVALAAALVCPVTAHAQRAQTREGFWFNVGLGWGSLGCEDCDDRTGGFSGALGLGGTLSQKLVLGAAYNFWSKTEEDETLTDGTLTAAIRFYPSSTGGFFLHAGLGLGLANYRIEDSVLGSFEINDEGFGALFGLGYDIRVARNMSLTPFANFFGVVINDSNSDVFQIGLGITFH